MARHKYTRELLEEAVKNSRSVMQVIDYLGLSRAGGTHSHIKSRLAYFEIDTSHFTGQAWNKGGKSFNVATPIENILVENSTYTNTSRLKGRLVDEGLLPPVCSAPFCPVPNPSVNPFTGEETPLKLALDHINGIRSDNRLENLRLLCYHCHGETETFAGKNVKLKRQNSPS